MSTKKKAIVTGGAGFIGANLVRELVTKGYEVHIIDTFVAGRMEERLLPGVPIHEVDVRDEAAIAKLFDGADVVFHLAALPRVQDSIERPIDTHDVNVNGTLSVLEAARKSNVGRVVFASSAAVYGEQEEVPLSENLPALPKSPYGLHKYLSEEMLKLWSDLYHQETVACRFFNVYGPYLDPEGPYALVVGRFLLQHKNKEPLTIVGDGSHTRDYVHVADIVRGLMAAATSTNVGKGEVINLGGGTETSVNELAEAFGDETTNVEPRIEPARSCADITRAKRLLGWEPTIPLEVGIQDLLERI